MEMSTETFPSNVTQLSFPVTDWSDHMTILKIITFSIITVGTILQNGVLLIAVIFDKRLRKSLPNFFIVNLAVADLLVGLLVLPFSSWEALTGDWPFGHIFCVIWSTMDFWCCSASIYSIGVITVDRYVGVTRPLFYPQIMTHRRNLYLIFGVWFISGLISLAQILIWPMSQNSDRYCLANSEQEHYLVTSFYSFFIPMLTIVIMYWRIYMEAAKVGRSLRTHQKIGSVTSEDTTETSLRIHVRGNKSASDRQMSSQKQTIKFLREKKAAWTVGIVAGAFMICWFPFFTIVLLAGFNIHFDFMNRLFYVFIWFGYSNSFLSPIIYVATNRRFKGAFWNCVTQSCARLKL